MKIVQAGVGLCAIGSGIHSVVIAGILILIAGVLTYLLLKNTTALLK